MKDLHDHITKINKMLADAFSLPEGTTNFTLTAGVDQIPTITATYKIMKDGVIREGFLAGRLELKGQ